MTLNYLLYFCTPAKISIIFKYEHITPKKWMRLVKPKKSLGQHFLKDLQIAERIADTLSVTSSYLYWKLAQGWASSPNSYWKKDTI